MNLANTLYSFQMESRRAKPDKTKLFRLASGFAKAVGSNPKAEPILEKMSLIISGESDSNLTGKDMAKLKNPMPELEKQEDEQPVEQLVEQQPIEQPVEQREEVELRRTEMAHQSVKKARETEKMIYQGYTQKLKVLDTKRGKMSEEDYDKKAEDLYQEYVDKTTGLIDFIESN